MCTFRTTWWCGKTFLFKRKATKHCHYTPKFFGHSLVWHLIVSITWCFHGNRILTGILCKNFIFCLLFIPLHLFIVVAFVFFTILAYFFILVFYCFSYVYNHLVIVPEQNLLQSFVFVNCPFNLVTTLITWPNFISFGPQQANRIPV